MNGVEKIPLGSGVLSVFDLMDMNLSKKARIHQNTCRGGETTSKGRVP